MEFKLIDKQYNLKVDLKHNEGVMLKTNNNFIVTVAPNNGSVDILDDKGELKGYIYFNNNEIYIRLWEKFNVKIDDKISVMGGVFKGEIN